MFFVAGSESGYFIAKSFGQVYFTSNGLAGAASPKPGSAGNGFDQLRRLAGDPANPNRMWAVFPGGGPSYVRRTPTAGTASSTGRSRTATGARSPTPTTSTTRVGRS